MFLSQSFLRVPGPSRLGAQIISPRLPRQPCRFLNTLEQENPGQTPLPDTFQDEFEHAKYRKRKSEWKRRQRGQTFLDHLIVTVRGGKGGDGCVAFHREKFVEHGPPSGGDGGRGGDVYIRPSPHLTTLSSVSNRVRGNPGGNGMGTWLNGRAGQPTIIDVPLGTVVRSLPPDDPQCAPDEWDAEEDSLAGIGDPDERLAKMRARRWVHYPGYADNNVGGDFFAQAEEMMAKEERARKRETRRRANEMVALDLDALHITERPVDAPIGTPREHHYGHLLVSGGPGGVGNPHFLTKENRSPKMATRGQEGELITLSLELKILADIGLVGYPNAGKSTVLRALTGGRAKTEVAGYAFTTLNPVVGIVRVYEDGSYALGEDDGMTYDETLLETLREKEQMRSGALADALTRNQKLSTLTHRPSEVFRFSIADNPGLIDEASEDVGLGHSFLRSIERSWALAYVVDLAGPAPWDELRILRDELEKYKPGLSAKARIVIANKADLLGEEGEENSGAHDDSRSSGKDAVEQAWARLRQLETFVQDQMGAHIDVVPVSAKYNLNLRRVVELLRKYVEEARASPIEFEDQDDSHLDIRPHRSFRTLSNLKAPQLEHLREAECQPFSENPTTTTLSNDIEASLFSSLKTSPIIGPERVTLERCIASSNPLLAKFRTLYQPGPNA